MDRFLTIARASELSESRGLTVRVGEYEVALFNIAGEIHALDGRCPHRGGSLGEGAIQDGTVFCPLHGWQFDIRTGACLDKPDRPARCWPVRVVDGQIQVQL
jgi:nitrite reductase (NADH) small subunit